MDPLLPFLLSPPPFGEPPPPTVPFVPLVFVVIVTGPVKDNPVPPVPPITPLAFPPPVTVIPQFSMLHDN